MGKIIDDPKDFYSDRATKRESKRVRVVMYEFVLFPMPGLQSLVDDLLRDAAFRKRAKDKFLAIHKVPDCCTDLLLRSPIADSVENGRRQASLQQVGQARAAQAHNNTGINALCHFICVETLTHDPQRKQHYID